MNATATIRFNHFWNWLTRLENRPRLDMPKATIQAMSTTRIPEATANTTG